MNTRSKVKVQASEKLRDKDLDDELGRHIDMLGKNDEQTGTKRSENLS